MSIHRFWEKDRPDLSTVAPVPVDVVAIVLLVIVTNALWLVLPSNLAVLHAPFGLSFLLFAPGYVLVMVLFPRGRRAVNEMGSKSDLEVSGPQAHVLKNRSIGWRARLTLSFGLSLALIPLLGLAITPFVTSFSSMTVFLSVSLFVLVGSLVGTVRRSYVPKGERYRVPYGRTVRGLRARVLGDSPRLDRAIYCVLILSVLVAVGTLGFSLIAPLNGEAYTGAALLTENGDGDLVASGYPTNLTRGENSPLILRVENFEDRRTSYTVVAKLQRVEGGEDTVTVVEEEELLREHRTVGVGETWTFRHSVTPTMVGDNLRLTYHVYRGKRAEQSAEGPPYRRLYLWVDVSGQDGEA